jgi:hypothetical protein
MFCFFSLYGQEVDSLQKEVQFQRDKQLDITFPELLKKDNTLKLIFSLISEEWAGQLKNDTLEIYSTNPIYKLEVMQNQQSNRTGRRGAERKMSITDTSTAIISFKIEPLWSANKVQEAIMNNSVIQTQIKNVSKRLDIEHIIHLIDNEAEEINFSETHRKSIAIFKYEREILENELVIVPSYHIEHYSLFFISSFPEKNEYASYIPERITEHLEIIFSLFELYAGK